MPATARGLYHNRGPAIAEWIAGTLVAIVILWLAFNLFTDSVHLSVDLSMRVRSGEDVASAVTRLFAALALGLVPREDGGRRLHWLAAGFLVLGLGHLAFSYVQPILQGGPTPLGEGRMEAFLVRSLTGLIFVAALLPTVPPLITAWAAVAVAGLVVVFYLLIELIVETRIFTLDVADRPADGALQHDMSAWWVSLTYIGLAFAAAVGANRRHRLGDLRDWLLIALVFWSGSLLHDALWPPSYSGAAVTTGDLLRFAFTVTVAVGAVLELRRIAAERAQLLAAEREYSRRLAELSQLRSDFNAMVIHELGSPATTIRNFTEVLASGGIRPADQAPILNMLRGESERMLVLIDDVQSTAAAERDEFTVALRPVPVADILADAVAFAGTVLDERRFTVVNTVEGETVLADPVRIGQVLRNLIGNAVKYTPPGTAIELRAFAAAPGWIRIEVVDEGDGIHPDDLDRIFDKFGRGRRPSSGWIAGTGLGLYLSRRIVRLHGSDLTVTSTPGAGAVFGFKLETVAP